jgi:hypothetical protein
MGKVPRSAPAEPLEGVAPVIPDELIKGEWHRRLVLPNQDGRLRLTPVRKPQEDAPADSTRIRYLDDKRRHSA